MKNNKPQYVRCVVMAVPKKKLPQYKKQMKAVAKIWLEHGAISYFDSVGDVLDPGPSTSFPQTVSLKKGEVVVLSWSTYKSRAHCQSVLKKMMRDPRMAKLMDPSNATFDWNRMYWGGFKPIL